MQFSLCVSTKVVSLFLIPSFFVPLSVFLIFMMIWNPNSWDRTLFLTEAYVEFWDFWPFPPQHIIHQFFLLLFFSSSDITIALQFSFVHATLF